MKRSTEVASLFVALHAASSGRAVSGVAFVLLLMNSIWSGVLVFGVGSSSYSDALGALITCRVP